MGEIKLYTDGSCLKNPNGAGGWAFVVTEDNKEIHREWGFSPSTTNNIMEIMAVDAALKWVQNNDTSAEIFSDSQYVVFSLTQWMKPREKRGWVKSFRNRELLLDLYFLYKDLSKKGVKIKWVRGHRSCKWNNVADEIAGDAARQYI